MFVLGREIRTAALTLPIALSLLASPVVAGAHSAKPLVRAVSNPRYLARLAGGPHRGLKRAKHRELRDIRKGITFVSGIDVAGDGTTVVGGNIFKGKSLRRVSAHMAIARYTTRGRIDPSIGVISPDVGTETILGDVLAQPDGRILAAGEIANPARSTDAVLLRLTADGHLDPSFGAGGVTRTDYGRDAGTISLALQPDGRILALEAAPQSGTSGLMLARYTQSGAPDPSFGTGGRVAVPLTDFPQKAEISVRADGSIEVATTQVAVKRKHGLGPSRASAFLYTAAGAPDPAFGVGGATTLRIPGLTGGFDFPDLLGIDPAGRALAGGQHEAIKRHAPAHGTKLMRIGANGALDTNWNLRSGKVDRFIFASPEALVVQPDGSAIQVVNDFDAFLAARYGSTGALDPTFGTRGFATRGLAIQPVRQTNTGYALLFFTGTIAVTSSNLVADGDPTGGLIAAFDAGGHRKGFQLVRIGPHGEPDNAFARGTEPPRPHRRKHRKRP